MKPNIHPQYREVAFTDMSIGKTYNDSTSLGEYEGRLAGQAFYRIHKTCLVQLRYVESIFPWTGSGFALRVHGTDSVLPIGRERVRELRRRLSI